MASHAVHNEVAYAFHSLFCMVPSLRAPAQQRAGYHLFKSEVFEAWAAIEPSAAAQALQLAARARREAHAIAADY